MPARHLFGGFTHHLFGGPRRPAVPLTPSHSTPDSPARTLLHPLYTSFAYKNQTHPLSPQPLPHSYTKTPGCQGLHLQTLSRKRCHSDRLSISADFALFTPHAPRATDHAPTDHAPLTPLSATLTRNGGRGASTLARPGSCAMHAPSRRHPLARAGLAPLADPAIPPLRKTRRRHPR